MEEKITSRQEEDAVLLEVDQLIGSLHGWNPTAMLCGWSRKRKVEQGEPSLMDFYNLGG